MKIGLKEVSESQAIILNDSFHDLVRLKWDSTTNPKLKPIISKILA